MKIQSNGIVVDLPANECDKFNNTKNTTLKTPINETCTKPIFLVEKDYKMADYFRTADTRLTVEPIQRI